MFSETEGKYDLKPIGRISNFKGMDVKCFAQLKGSYYKIDGPVFDQTSYTVVNNEEDEFNFGGNIITI